MNRLALPFALAALAIASTARAEDPTSNVERCDKPLGTIAVSEHQGASTSQLTSYGLGSPVSLLRIIIQQSNCFTVVERGVAMQNLQQERALAESGESMGGSNLGRGQLQAADFVMTPSIQFAAGNTGGMNGSLSSFGGKFLGGLGGVIGGLAGNVKFKEAQTSLLIADVRSGIQVAAAEGQAKKTDFGVSGWNWGGNGYTSLGGYTNTPEGKMVAASLLDNFNKIVISIRVMPSLIKTKSAESRANAAASTRAGMPIAAGTSMFARLANVKVLLEPKAGSKVLGTLKKSDEVIASGEEEGAYIKVDSENHSGAWVLRSLMASAQAGGQPQN
jgi:curli biogenesis system outer membrane secretion channel CsgG